MEELRMKSRFDGSAFWRWICALNGPAPFHSKLHPWPGIAWSVSFPLCQWIAVEVRKACGRDRNRMSPSFHPPADTKIYINIPKVWVCGVLPKSWLRFGCQFWPQLAQFFWAGLWCLRRENEKKEKKKGGERTLVRGLPSSEPFAR